jgi:hypothetical protein
VVVKVKPNDAEVLLSSGRMATMCGPRLAQAFNRHKNVAGMLGCHVRELALYGIQDPRLSLHMPRVFTTYQDEAREAYILALERLDDMILLDSSASTDGWGHTEIEAVLRGAAAVHAVWYSREAELLQESWLQAAPTAKRMTAAIPLWEALGVHAAEEFPDWFSAEDLTRHRTIIQEIPSWWQHIERQPRTLIHNDFNTRNICLRPTPEGPRLCAYDWELATLHLPQHDLAEFLAFALPPEVTRAEVEHYVEFHRQELVQQTGQQIDPETWQQGYKACLFDLAVCRVALYMMAHTFRHYAFMRRLAKTLRHLIGLVRDIPL